MDTQSLNTQRFIAEYLKDFNPRVAILVAGYKGKDADTAGMKLLQEPGIQNEIIRVIEARAQALADSTPDLFKKLWLIVSADVTELVQVTHGCCRHCWGRDFRYQRTPEEQRQHLAKGGENDGSERYDRRKPPNPDCPECFGEGETHTRHTPTEQLSPAARALCAGYVQTKSGPRLKLHNQLKALEILVRHQNHWIKPKEPPIPTHYQSPEDKEREERLRRELQDGTFDPVEHERREARDTVKQQTERIEWLRQEIEKSGHSVRRCNAILAPPADIPCHSERSEESRLVRAGPLTRITQPPAATPPDPGRAP